MRIAGDVRNVVGKYLPDIRIFYDACERTNRTRESQVR